MREIKRYLVTAALPYANGPLHIGHLAGAYLSSDVYVRFLRSSGKDALFICGSDEHGAAITTKSIKENTTPQEIVDKYHEMFKDTFQKMGVSFDMYHRTSDPLHHETSQEFFRNLNEKGEFIKKESEQYYDTEANQFLADRYIKGTCPKCQHPEAYGDQCENCGSSLSPTELIDPQSTLSGKKPELRSTTHWYLSLDKSEEWLKEWINNGTSNNEKLHYPEDWKNHVLGQCNSWLESGLQPRSMTRDLSWGVDVPQELEGSEGKKLYVWLDAPIGYISATKQWAIDNNKDWEPYWKDESTALVHFIGKDNIVFHCIIFPAILQAHGDYVLPINVPANQFMNLEGDKISTSRNWAVWVHEYLKDFPGQEDVLRYVMIKNMPESKDSEFTWKGFQDANNNELVNNLANFVNRVIVLINKYYDGIIPEFDEDLDIIGCDHEDEISFHDSEVLRLFDNVDAICSSLRKYEFRAGLTQLMQISSNGNQILQFNEPWKKIKEDPEQVKVVMNLLAQYVHVISICIKPFMPFTSDKLCNLLNTETVKEDGELLNLTNDLAEGIIPLSSGHKISKPEHLFSRIDDDVIQAQLDKLNASKKENAAVAVAPTNGDIKETIAYDDFVKLDLRAATIVEADKVKKADKLLQLKLDLGFEQRIVVSGIAQHFKPEEIIGTKVTLLSNLAPRKIRGVESKGMILMAENEDGELHFVRPAESAQNGSKIS
jgi:methionyl-tRNA synthetase